MIFSHESNFHEDAIRQASDAQLTKAGELAAKEFHEMTTAASDIRGALHHINRAASYVSIAPLSAGQASIASALARLESDIMTHSRRMNEIVDEQTRRLEAKGATSPDAS